MKKFSIFLVFFFTVFSLTAMANEPYYQFNEGLKCLENIEYEKALKHFRRAAEIYEDLGEIESYIKSVLNMGITYWLMSQNNDAERCFNEVIRLTEDNSIQRIQYKPIRAKAFNNLGNIYFEQGLYEKAIEYYEKASERSYKFLYTATKANTLMGLGLSYYELGQYDKALPYLEEGLNDAKLIPQIGKGFIIAGAYSAIAKIYLQKGRYEEALKYSEKALKTIEDMIGSDKPHVRMRKVNILLGFCNIYIHMEQYNKALEYGKKVLDIARSIPGWEKTGGISIALSTIGSVYLELDQYEEAIEYFNEALRIEQNTDWFGGESSFCELGLGKSYKGIGKLHSASEYYISFVDKIENVRRNIEVKEHKMSYMSGSEIIYKELIEVLVELGRYDEAFDYMERSRSRLFLDLLASGEYYSSQGMDRKTQEKDQYYQKKISDILSKLMDDYNNENLRAELTALEAEYEGFIREVAAENGELATLISVNALTLEETQKLLESDVSIIEYITTEDTTYAFLITKDTLKVYEIPVSEDDLKTKVNDILIPNISNKKRRPESVINDSAGGTSTSNAEIESNRQDFLENAQEFYDLLIKPIESGIATDDLIIIPYGSLHKVPFVALHDGNQYLIDKYAISVLPSASVLSYLPDKGRSNGGKLLAFADPKTDAVPLYYAETEVDEITRLFPNNKIYKKDDATETNFKNISGGYDIIHMACHGEFNDRTPILSCLLLTKDSQNDGYLRLNEFFGLDLTEANLVTLSACETALSEVQAGDDLVGMSRCLIYAGAESVLASLWSVDDKSTAILMTKFYEKWKSGMDKAEALRQAQIHVKSLEGYEHPFYWAAFELIGAGE